MLESLVSTSRFCKLKAQACSGLRHYYFLKSEAIIRTSSIAVDHANGMSKGRHVNLVQI
jgi:hypothetical protein